MTGQTRLDSGVLSRFVCSTWSEATGNGGPPFDVVVIGAGMYGAYLAAKVWRSRPDKRVLLLDAGGFAVPEHVQNIGSLPLYPPAPIPADDDHGVVRNQLWDIPWRGQVEFPGLAYCLGGRSLFHGAWFPAPTHDDLLEWPAGPAGYLRSSLPSVAAETGAARTDDLLFGPLQGELRTLLGKATAEIADLDSGTVVDAPLAVQAAPPDSGMYAFDKFSSVPILMDAVHDDREQARNVDAYRRLFVVPYARVTGLVHAGGVVDGVDVEVDGRRQRLRIDPHCSVVLALSAIESTRLAMTSFRTPLMGRNLMAHTRSDFTVRVRRSVLPGLAPTSESAALLIRGEVPTGRFHLQVTASTSVGDGEGLLFRVLHDLDQLTQLRSIDPDWVVVTIRGVGQMHGDREAAPGDPARSWIDLSTAEDEYGTPRALVNLAVSEADLTTWRAMDAAAVALAEWLGSGPGDVEYLYDDGWQQTPFPLDRSYPSWHNPLGSTHHEAGTLWMGDDPDSSVTDGTGRFHHLANAFACDQSVFPVVGSVNPALTGLTLARRLAGLL